MAKAKSRAVATEAKASGLAKLDARQRARQLGRTAILLKQASDATRVQVILMLVEGEMNATAIGEGVGQSLPAVSYHMALLRHGGIIVGRRDGGSTIYGLTEDGEGLAQAVRALMG